MFVHIGLLRSGRCSRKRVMAPTARIMSPRAHQLAERSRGVTNVIGYAPALGVATDRHSPTRLDACGVRHDATSADELTDASLPWAARLTLRAIARPDLAQVSAQACLFGGSLR